MNELIDYVCLNRYLFLVQCWRLEQCCLYAWNHTWLFHWLLHQHHLHGPAAQMFLLAYFPELRPSPYTLNTVGGGVMKTEKQRGKPNLIRLFTLGIKISLPVDQITRGQTRYIIVYTWWKCVSNASPVKIWELTSKAGSLRATENYCELIPIIPVLVTLLCY